MAPVWNPREALDVDPNGSFTCVGTTKKGARCRQSRFSRADLSMASKLLDRMEASNPRHAKRHLRPLAEVTLCPRWHRKPGYSQVEMMRHKWWNIIVSINVELPPIAFTIPSPISLPRNVTRALPSTEYTSASRRLLTLPSSPPTPTPVPRLQRRDIRQSLDLSESISASLSLATPLSSPSIVPLEPRALPEETSEALNSNGSNPANLNLLTPPTSPPSPVLEPRLLPEETAEDLEYNESALAGLSLLTVPTSPPYTPGPRLPQRNMEQILGFTVSTMSTLADSSSSTPPTSPPSPTPAPRLLRRNMRQSLDTDEFLSARSSLPESTPLSLVARVPLLEDTSQTLGFIESPSGSRSPSAPTSPSLEPREQPLPTVQADPANVRRATLMVDPTVVTPSRAPSDLLVRSESLSNESTFYTVDLAVTMVDPVTSAQSLGQESALNDNNSTSTPLPAAIPTAIVSTSRTQSTTLTTPQRKPFNTWPEFTLERPMQFSLSSYSYSGQPDPHADTSPKYKEEAICSDTFSCLNVCRTNILSGCSTLWGKVCDGRKAISAYICCSPWQYELQD